MFLGIHKASLPISIADPQGIRRRLLAQDNIGIIPSYESLHRANQHFAKDKHIYDVLYYDDLGRYEQRIRTYFKTSPQTQSLCWNKVVNPRNWGPAPQEWGLSEAKKLGTQAEGLGSESYFKRRNRGPGPKGWGLSAAKKIP